VDAIQAKAVAEVINARLNVLGWDQIDLVRASEVSPTTVRELQQGTAKTYRRSTLNKVARALGWTSDSLLRVMEGEQPVIQPDEWSPLRTGGWRPSRDLAALASELTADRRQRLLGYLDRLLDEQERESRSE
jgi:DNA-binding Xre family transcriptional regulator